MAFCGNCGNELREGAMYCPKCGTAVGNTNRSNGTSSKSYVKWIGALALLAVLCVGGYFGYNALSSDSPGEVAVKAYSYLKDNDVKSFMSYVYVEHLSRKRKYEKLDSVAKANPEEYREIEKEALNMYGLFGGIKDVSLHSEDIKGDEAFVNIQLNFNDGKQHFQDLKLRKNKYGEWGVEQESFN